VSAPRCIAMIAILLAAACGDAPSDVEPGTTSSSGSTAAESTDGAAVCGNGIIEADEACDGLDLADENCATQGFASGVLQCLDCDLDTSDCTNCGNGILDANEPCDGELSNGQTCASEGFLAGDIACSAACELDASACHDCGNAIIDDGEICETGMLGEHTCASLGHGDGELACGDDCRSFATTGCSALVCDEDPDTGAAEACPAACSSCDDQVCNIDCFGNSACSSTTIACPAGWACNVTCDGHSACSSSTVRCPAHWSCDIACSDPAACTAMTIECSDDGTCELACGSGGGGLCAGTTLRCGRDACAAACDGEADVLVQCDMSCSCSPC
jgi:hypothetical protein